MEAIFELFAIVISIVFRTLILVVAVPFVLLWPRRDKSLAYWQVVLSRFRRVFGHALM